MGMALFSSLQYMSKNNSIQSVKRLFLKRKSKIKQQYGKKRAHTNEHIWKKSTWNGSKHRKTKGEQHIAITITITNSSSSSSSSSQHRSQPKHQRQMLIIYTYTYMHVLQESSLSVLATQKRRNWNTFLQNICMSMYGIVFLFCSDYFLLQCLRFKSFQRNFLVFLLIILAFLCSLCFFSSFADSQMRALAVLAY